MRNSLTGGVLLAYEAYRVVEDDTSTTTSGSSQELEPITLIKECSAPVNVVNIYSRASSLAWRTGNVSTATGGAYFHDRDVPVMTPDQSTTSSATGLVGQHTVQHSAPLEYYSFISGLLEDQSDIDDVAAQLHQMRFHVKDYYGEPAPAVVPQVKWTSFPQYLTGYTTYLMPGCLSTESFRQMLLSGPNPEYAGRITSCSSFMMDRTIMEYGLSQTVIDSTPLFMIRPFAPFATVIAERTDANGDGWIAVNIHRGHPGLYSLTVQADGMRTMPMLIPIRNELARMNITAEPALQAGWATTMGITLSTIQPDGTWSWKVGEMLGEPMTVRMLDSEDNPLPGYRPNVRAVDENGNSLEHLVQFDTEQGGISGTGARQGTPATNLGLSYVSLLLLDAVNGTCFQLEAFFKAFDQDELETLSTEGLDEYADVRTSVISPARFCAINSRTMSVVSEPSTAVQLGGTLEEKPVISAASPLVKVTIRAPPPVASCVGAVVTNPTGCDTETDPTACSMMPGCYYDTTSSACVDIPGCNGVPQESCPYVPGCSWTDGTSDTTGSGESGSGGGICSDACQVAGDGDCDDGGPGSEFTDCTYGTDCSDCGTREDLSSAPSVDLWYLPDGYGMMFSYQMSVQAIGGTVLGDDAVRRQIGMRALTGNKCISYGGMAVAGRCTNMPMDPTVTSYPASDVWSPENSDIASGRVTGGVPYEQVITSTTHPWFPFGFLGGVPLFAAVRGNDPPTFIQKYRFDDLRWVRSVPGMGNTINFAATTNLILDSPSGAITSTVQAEESPASVEITSIPPREVGINEPFIITARVRISSGAPLRGALVTVSTTPVQGPPTSPFAFLQSVIGQQTVDASSDPATLSPSGVSAFTDARGVARFVLKFSSGPLESYTSLQLHAGAVRSTRTPPMLVQNDIAHVNATNLTLTRTNAFGIGSPTTYAVQVLGLPAETFPVNCTTDPAADGPIRVRVQLWSEYERPRYDNLTWVARALTFRAFDHDAVMRLRRQEMVIANALENITNALGGLALQTATEGAGEAVETLDDAQTEVVASVSADVSTAISTATGGAIPAGAVPNDIIERALMQSLAPDAASAAAMANPDMLIQFLTLMLGGTMPSSATPQGPVSAIVAVAPLDPANVYVESYDPATKVVELVIDSITLQVESPGRFYIQPMIAGVAGPLGGEIVIERYNSKTLQAVAMECASPSIPLLSVRQPCSTCLRLHHLYAPPPAHHS